MEIVSGNLTQHIRSFRYFRELSLALIVGIALFVGYSAYDQYANHREAQANLAFAEAYELYEQALTTEQGSREQQDMMLEEAESAFKSGYSQHASSRLAPYFLGLQADVLVKRGNNQEAVETLHKMLSLLKNNSPLKYLYETKLALIQMDMPQAREEGINLLQKLSKEAGNENRDYALYMLGEYYWSAGDTAQATTAWQALRELGNSGTHPVTSPWLALVQQRIS